MHKGGTEENLNFDNRVERLQEYLFTKNDGLISEILRLLKEFFATF